ncbi:MAG: hypothetical protein CMN01_03705 [Rickettsiales bacterium]|nr:hypothetical protein [Rickettsiales bacterium]|tara:strand:- start:1275 stop:1970 length:696 start_codon:yes stop_codon:yes gene_type:complete
MSKLLVSCKNASEVSVIKHLVDIIDLKNSDDGALGAWKTEEILNVTKHKNSMPPISATLGNYKDIELIIQRLRMFDKLGLDYIKFGIFTSVQEEIDYLLYRVEREEIKTKIVAVLFADFEFHNDDIKISLMKFSKFKIRYVMLDTIKKKNLSLLQIYDENFLKELVKMSKSNNIKIGFAGQIKEEDLNKLIKLDPYLCGIRSAACFEKQRKNQISKTNVKKIKFYFDVDNK